jgi:hypothetical protein
MYVSKRRYLAEKMDRYKGAPCRERRRETEERQTLGALAFGDDESICALQAADFIAWEVCKIYTEVESGQNRFRASLRSLLG